ncbi:MAG: TetR/AcrR family transcriptional regulator [Mailhella sp.]|nr:TetR/AcrR family transcriptional regulator [Mailhella sp.]
MDISQTKNEAQPAPEPRKKRAYNSPRRKQQADTTKKLIVKAARRQLAENGYAELSLDDIAKEAGVALQTVYAVCGSKKGLMAAILENFVEENHYDTLRDEVPHVKGGRERCRAMTDFMTRLLEANAPAHQVIRGIGIVSPKLGSMEYETEAMLYDKEMLFIKSLERDGYLKDGITAEEACDIAFGLCAPGFFRRMCGLRSWSRERFADLVFHILSSLILKDEEAEQN